MITTIISKLRVLVVDDEAIMRTHVAELLRQIGIHQIREAAGGLAALLEAIQFQPDLVLTDIHMEPMDGIEFVRKMRALPNPYFTRVPVIMMTVDTSKETLNEVLPLGVNGYLVKPPRLDTLKAKIKSVVN